MEPIKEVKPNVSPSLRAVFEIDQGGRKQTLLVGKDRIVLGSVDSADIKLNGGSVSPIHALLEIKWGGTESSCEVRLIDLASPTGVLVNGTPTVNAMIRSGDLIQIGDALVRFSIKKPDLKKVLPDQALLLIDPATVTPIFDYRPQVKEALEVVSSWNGVILNVKHFVQEERITLGGSGKEDFQIPRNFLAGRAYPLATRKGKEWTLRLDASMKGILYLGGSLYSISDFLKEMKVKGPSASVVLRENDFVKIQLGLLSFYLSRTVSPPVLLKSAEIITDPFLGRTLAVSVLLTLMLLFGVSRLDPTPTEPESLPPTVATILYHPEKYSINRPTTETKKLEEEGKAPEPTKNAVIDFTKPKEKNGRVAQVKSDQPGKRQSAQNLSKEGRGARAKRQEGSRGAKKAPPSSAKQNAANRPSPKPGVGRGGTASQAPDQGNVQMMKGTTSKILDLLGGSGQRLGASGSKIQGFGGFTTQGHSGTALQGGGKGGGGNVDTLLGGTGEQGRGGGRVGTGLAAEGTGSGIIGGKTRIELNTGGGNETVVIGSIDRDAIDAAIRAHRHDLIYCFEREVNAGHPNLAGKIVTAFVIGGSGHASQLSIATSSIGSATVEKCVLGVIARIQFPQPAGNVPVSIKYPFAYTNASK